MIDLHPTVCNLCGGKVIFVDKTSLFTALPMEAENPTSAPLAVQE